ncbi:MAG TPA: class I SAM-dependent methyltransferase, partial [Bdellovibrio sp.]|nr:class I SAM-dependent methyltransferase [Bdellovibrio sp.]
MSAISDIQSQYSKLEAWLYDSIIAPGSVDVKLNVLRPWLKSLPKSAAVLDVGCGGGQVIAAVLNEYPNLQMVGIDNSPRQVQRAQAALKKISSQVKIYEDSVSQLHCPDQCFDFV